MPDAELNGLTHHWEDAGDGCLVLLHGAAGSSKQLMAHVEDLSKDFRVIVPDLRGLGRSARVDTAPVSAWVDDLRALQDHLGLGPLNIYGMTVGGRVAMRLAIENPERVRSLVIDAPVMYNEAEAQAGVAVQVDEQKMSDTRRRQLESFHGEDWRTAVTFYQTLRARPEWQDYFDLRELSKNIKARVLILRGDAPGDAYSAEHAFTLYRNVPGSWMWIRPNTDGALLRNAPEDTRALIRAFLRSSEGDGPEGSMY